MEFIDSLVHCLYLWLIFGSRYILFLSRMLTHAHTLIYAGSLFSSRTHSIGNLNISLLIWQSSINSELPSHQRWDAFVVYSAVGGKPHSLVWSSRPKGNITPRLTMLSTWEWRRERSGDQGAVETEWRRRISGAAQSEFTEGLCANASPLIKSTLSLGLSLQA